MHVIADLCVVPLGVGLSLSPYVATCQRILEEAGLNTQPHAYGTNVEGEWEQVFAALKRCHEVLHAEGAVRISSSLRLGTRSDRAQSLKDKIDSAAAQREAQGARESDDELAP